MATAHDVIEYWWALGPEGWFAKDDTVDAEIISRFSALHAAALAGGLTDWESYVVGRLALILLLDQFSRNMHRNDIRMYSGDPAALRIAKVALEQEDDRLFPLPHKRFYYMPFTHSENMSEQERCVAYHEALDDETGLKWAKHHADIVRKFGRFPHRNSLLGRETTHEEQLFLDEGGFTG